MVGLPKAYIKKWGVTKLAWKKFRAKALSGSRRKPRRKKSNPKRRSVRRMANKKKRRGGKSITRTAFKLIRIGALGAPALGRAMQKSSTQDKINDGVEDYTGYSLRHKDFKLERLARGWSPYLGACLATYGIPKLIGIIRKL